MRQALETLEIPDHIGLAYDAWAPIGADGKVPDNDRAAWFEALAKREVSLDYRHSFNRWKASFTVPGDRFAEFTLDSRLLIGQGNTSAVDLGLTVHHTWGVPMIPGSALKGLVAHYVEATYGPSEPNRLPWEQIGDERARGVYQGVIWDGSLIACGPGKVYRGLFGAPEARNDRLMREHGFDAGAVAGLVTFHDALYVPDSILSHKPFAADVLTVHQKGYYDAAGGDWPNDYESPNPVGFLTVRPKCRFLLVLSGPSDWTDLASCLLKDALEIWGVGGKTAAGYGFGRVGAWRQPEPRRSRAEQALFNLATCSKEQLIKDIEDWLRGEAVTGPLLELLSTPPDPDTVPQDSLMVVHALNERFAFRRNWADRLRNKKADEKKKARAQALIAAWDSLFS